MASATSRPHPASVAAPNEFLTTEQAAARVGISARQVRRLIAERRIGFYRCGRSVRIDPQEIIGYMLSGRVEPITETIVNGHLRSVA